MLYILCTVLLFFIVVLVCYIPGVDNFFCSTAKFRSQPKRRATWLYAYQILL